MSRHKVIQSWIEISQSFIHNQPPRQRDWEATLFVNRVEVREDSKGGRYLVRSTGCEFIPANDKQQMEDRIGKFMLREDVRILAKGIDANDFHMLPKEEKDPPESILNGLDDLYQQFEESPAAGAT
jgi:hypothetical protein